MKCRRCGSFEGEVALKRHNATFCRNCFVVFFRRQVKRAISEFRMFTPKEKILVCVSGGKDSLVLWDVLLDLGFDADGMYIDLGIGDYSRESREKVLAFARLRKREPIIVDLSAEGMTIPEVTARLRKKACSLCGMIKRHHFNSAARKGGYDVVATGHNLDDEASRLLGNIIQWNVKYFPGQKPVLEETSSGMVRKVKPLVRVTEYETACYALIRGIDYMIYECPYSKGATSLAYKEALNMLEEEMPGTKARFLFGFLDGEFFREDEKEESEGRSCLVCGEPSFQEVCSYCRLKEEVARRSAAGRKGA
ncbi:MAG: TIGR00269 family protein [Deltaproteobacteria bacterium]|nr:MAG: TIGR00269 family protein [Deltaproteobacteria bacterium]